MRNVKEQWYRVEWSDNAGSYPASYLSMLLSWLRSQGEAHIKVRAIGGDK